MAGGKKKGDKKSDKKNAKKSNARYAEEQPAKRSPKLTMTGAAPAMRSIPEPAPDTRTILHPTSNSAGQALFTGEGGTDYTCGTCGAGLLVAIQPGQMAGMVFVCPGCGSWNEFSS